MHKKHKHLVTLIIALAVGLTLSTASRQYSKVVSSIPQTGGCVGPAVIGYVCPELPKTVSIGYPLPYKTITYDYQLSEHAHFVLDSTSSETISKSKFVLNTLVLTALSMAAIEISMLLFTKLQAKLSR